MYFKDFAYQIGLVMKGNSTTSSFTHTLFDAILPEKKKNLLDGISENTYKAYYNGKTKITGIAKKIYPDVNPNLFKDFISKQGANINKKLSETFSSVLPEISPANAGSVLAELFYQIIKKAAENTSEQFQQEARQNIYMFGSNNTNINNSGTINFN